VTPFGRLLRARTPSAAAPRHLDALERLTTEALADLAALKDDLRTLSAALTDLRHTTAAAVAEQAQVAEAQAGVAAPDGARLASDALALVGRPSERMRVRRLFSGGRFERPFSPSVGLTRIASTAPDVRDLWARLEAREAGCADDVLRGAPAAALDVPDAAVSMGPRRALDIYLGASKPATAAPPAWPVVAVPKFTYQFSARKLRNVGHWVLDCLPQIVALERLAPDAVFLLPTPLKAVQRSTLAMLGLPESRLVPWNGDLVAAKRLLVLEDEGRAGGGRPLAALAGMRERLATRIPVPARPGTLRLYVSRRDAKPHRRWAANEPDIEALFERHGFRIVSMADCPLDEQMRLFSQAGVVAGISGAGLADLVFTPSGAHVIVLVSDDLMRWYADDGQSRSLWLRNAPVPGGALAELGDSPRFYGHVAAAFGQVAHYFVAADQMPLDQLSGFVDDVMGTVEASAS
jgi:hypothetical protein